MLDQEINTFKQNQKEKEVEKLTHLDDDESAAAAAAEAAQMSYDDSLLLKKKKLFEEICARLPGRIGTVCPVFTMERRRGHGVGSGDG